VRCVVPQAANGMSHRFSFHHTKISSNGDAWHYARVPGGIVRGKSFVRGEFYDNRIPFCVAASSGPGRQ
jgi:hypothetical protein